MEFPPEQLECTNTFECLCRYIDSLLLQHLTLVLPVCELLVEVLVDMVAEEDHGEANEVDRATDVEEPDRAIERPEGYGQEICKCILYPIKLCDCRTYGMDLCQLIISSGGHGHLELLLDRQGGKDLNGVTPCHHPSVEGATTDKTLC